MLPTRAEFVKERPECVVASLLDTLDCLLIGQKEISKVEEERER
jgi:hypothetical protein